MTKPVLVLSILILPILPMSAAADVGTIDCYCTDSDGGRVELGQEICLYVDGRAFMALCDMSLNNPIWRDTGRGYLHSRLPETGGNQTVRQ